MASKGKALRKGLKYTPLNDEHGHGAQKICRGRRKRSGLESIPDMPVDILIEVRLYLEWFF
jgi:hypothetical protein